jgi:predicted glutamine amidotransferase
LHVLERSKPNDERRPGRAVLVASEPATNERWSEVADGSIVTIDQDFAVDIRRI